MKFKLKDKNNRSANIANFVELWKNQNINSSFGGDYLA